MSESQEAARDHGVAIIGMAGRFPGAGDVEGLWRNLLAGVESITFFTPEELIAAGNDPDLVRRPDYVPAKGRLEGVEGFDPAFFGLTPKEGAVLDPQQRLLLECSWEALENAGYDAGRVGARAAVFAGTGAASYLVHHLLPSSEDLERIGRLQVFLLNDRDFAATRVSYALGLRGPSAAVQTACSTSLMAVHMACQSLLSGEADLALAGGASIGLPQVEGYLYQEGSISSPDGHCRSYDAGAGGSVGGDGAGVVVLKRVADALADGDTIHAVVLGSAANNDGAAKVGFTAPAIDGQAEVIVESLLMAGVGPESIGYVEGHGSATALGDPIEVAALRQAFERAGHDGRPCGLGSIKSNLGHLNTAAGVAGLIKTALALRAGVVPPSLHFREPNPRSDFGPFRVPIEATPWPTGSTPRRAGVSSFGLGGTNVHAVLEEAPPSEPAGPSRPWQLLTLSARTPSALALQAERLEAHLAARLEAGEAPPLADVAFTLQAGRKRFPHRRALVCRDGAEAVAALRAARGSFGAFEGGSRPAAFLFPGLGDHYLDMGRELYAGEPAYAREVDRCAEILRPHLGLDVRTLLFRPEERRRSVPAGPPASADLRALLRRGGEERGEADRLLDRTEHAQPALFTVEYALARLLVSWGIRPQACVGYSLGEYVAACLSGVLALEDALRLVAVRARLIQRLSPGAMLAVPLPEGEVAPLLGDRVSLAATNGPHFSVAGGAEDAIAELEAVLAGRGVVSLRLTTTHAFHTPMMEPAVAELTAVARSIAVGEPRIPYLSNVTGRWVTPADLRDPGYWARHMVRPVRFSEALGELLADPDRVLVEVGPGSTLSTLVRQDPRGGGRVAVSTLRRESDPGADLPFLLEGLGRLWVEGVELDSERFFAGERRRRVPLPTYPFERQRCWIDPPARGGAPLGRGGAAAAAPAELARQADLADWFWVPVWQETAPLFGSGGGDESGWLVFLDRGGIGTRLAGRLRGEGKEVTTVSAGVAFQADGEGVTLDPLRPEDYEALVHHLSGRVGGLPGRVAHLWGLDLPEGGHVRRGELLSLVFLTRALATAGAGAPIRIALAGSGFHRILEEDRVRTDLGPVVGAAKVLRQESSRLSCFTLDLPAVAAGGSERAEEWMAGRILAELERKGSEPAVAYRGGRRWVRTFDRVALPAEIETRRGEEGGSTAALRPGGAYLVTDGSHPGGAALARWLAVELHARVVLLLPPAFPAPEIWEGWEPRAGEESWAAAVPALAALRAEAPELLTFRADPLDVWSLRAALDQARDRFGPLEGAFHTPGAFSGGLIQLKTREALEAALAPVEEGSRALLAALEDEPAAFVVLLSSTLAFTGGLGQVDLAAAGSSFDALAQGEAESARRVVAAHWDPYQWQGWLVAGLGAMLPPADREKLAASSVPPAESGEALRRLLASGLRRVVVSARDLGALIAETDALTAESLMAQMDAARKAAGAHSRAALGTAYVAPRDDREERLAALWEGLFGIAPIGIEDSFLELGGHSLLAIQTVTQVRSLFDVELPVTALFEAPTIAELARWIGRARGEESPEDLEALLALVEGLTPEEAERRLTDLPALGGLPGEAPAERPVEVAE